MGLFSLGVDYKRGPEKSNLVPGLRGTIGNEETLRYLENLPSFQALPDLPKVYFSTGDNAGCGDPVLSGPNAGTCLPLGVDTNKCTPSEPCLTWTKCEELSQFGNIQCVFDASDTWSAAGEHTGDNNFSLGTTAVCNRPGEACVVWSGSDRTGGDPAEFDCTGVFAGAGYGTTQLFAWNTAAVNNEFWAFENLRFENCPDNVDAVVADDLYRTNGPQDFLTLNVQTVQHRGPDNDYYTSHNNVQGGGDNQSVMISINPVCNIIEWVNGGNTAQCFDPTSSDDIIIIGGDLSSADDDAAVLDETLVTGLGGASGDIVNLSIIGTTIRNLDDASLGMLKTGLESFIPNNQNNRVNRFGALLVTLEGFDGDPSQDAILIGGGTVAQTGADLEAYLYKVGIQNSGIGIQFFGNTDPSNSYRLRGACIAIDAVTNILAALGGNGCDRVSVALDQVVADETTAGLDYFLEGVNRASGPLLEAASTTADCLQSPYITDGGSDRWMWNSTDDTTPFGAGASADVPKCRDTSCRNGCTVDGFWQFPGGRKIPAFVAGREITGFHFGDTSDIGR
jgi:hypothetical protein